MKNLVEIGTSSIITFITASNISADTLITALIGLGVSIVTVVGGELIKFLVSFLKNKTEKYSNKKEDEK